MQAHKPKVLIIDDEKIIRKSIKKLLDDVGFESVAADNELNGIELADENDFDLAIIDLKMPDINGIEVLKRIKKNKPNTVCFISTAFASYSSAIEAIQQGAYGYIPKPFDPDELITKLTKGYEKRVLLLEADRLRREKEENLLIIAQEKTKLKTIINSIQEGVLVINRAAELILFNSSALKYLELNELFIGDIILSLLPSQLQELVNKILHSDKPELKTYSSQIELSKELFIEAECSPVYHNENQLAGAVIILRNITKQKQIEKLKNQFISMVAHELKAPISAVSGFLNILLSDEINLTKNKKTEYLERSVERLNSLNFMINDLLDISRIELKQTHKQIEYVDVIEVLKTTLQLLEAEIITRNISVELNLDNSLKFIKIDSTELQRVFTNILSNAVKYNIPGGKILIEMKNQNNILTITFTDTGIGIDPKNIHKIFDEFYRVKNQKTKQISGTGLGLSIVKKIIESYTGKIEVKSELDNGTSFTISLPIV